MDRHFNNYMYKGKQESLPEGWKVLAVSERWDFLYRDDLNLANVDKAAKELSKKIQEKLIVFSNVDDDLIAFTFYENGKQITKHCIDYCYGGGIQTGNTKKVAQAFDLNKDQEKRLHTVFQYAVDDILIGAVGYLLGCNFNRSHENLVADLEGEFREEDLIDFLNRVNAKQKVKNAAELKCVSELSPGWNCLTRYDHIRNPQIGTFSINDNGCYLYEFKEDGSLKQLFENDKAFPYLGMTATPICSKQYMGVVVDGTVNVFRLFRRNGEFVNEITYEEAEMACCLFEDGSLITYNDRVGSITQYCIAESNEKSKRITLEDGICSEPVYYDRKLYYWRWCGTLVPNDWRERGTIELVVRSDRGEIINEVSLEGCFGTNWEQCMTDAEGNIYYFVEMGDRTGILYQFNPWLELLRKFEIPKRRKKESWVGIGIDQRNKDLWMCASLSKELACVNLERGECRINPATQLQTLLGGNILTVDTGGNFIVYYDDNSIGLVRPPNELISYHKLGQDDFVKFHDNEDGTVSILTCRNSSGKTKERIRVYKLVY